MLTSQLFKLIQSSFVFAEKEESLFVEPRNFVKMISTTNMHSSSRETYNSFFFTPYKPGQGQRYHQQTVRVAGAFQGSYSASFGMLGFFSGGGSGLGLGGLAAEAAAATPLLPLPPKTSRGRQFLLHHPPYYSFDCFALHENFAEHRVTKSMTSAKTSKLSSVVKPSHCRKLVTPFRI